MIWAGGCGPCEDTAVATAAPSLHCLANKETKETNLQNQTSKQIWARIASQQTDANKKQIWRNWAMIGKQIWTNESETEVFANESVKLSRLEVHNPKQGRTWECEWAESKHTELYAHKPGNYEQLLTNLNKRLWARIMCQRIWANKSEQTMSTEPRMCSIWLRPLHNACVLNHIIRRRQVLNLAIPLILSV